MSFLGLARLKVQNRKLNMALLIHRLVAKTDSHIR